MLRSAVAAALFAATCSLAASARPNDRQTPPDKTTGDTVTGSVADETLVRKAPEAGVICTKKTWDSLIEAWKIEKPFKADFARDIVVVATTRGSELKLTTTVDDGDLTIKAVGTADIKPGFRYVVRRLDRDGIKTVNGKPLPKE